MLHIQDNVVLYILFGEVSGITQWVNVVLAALVKPVPARLAPEPLQQELTTHITERQRKECFTRL